MINTIKSWIAIGSFAAGLTIAGSVSPLAWGSAQPQYGNEGYYREHPDLRQLIDQTQSDLQQASQFQHEKGKQRDRYRNAQKSLSTFDRHLTKGKFDKNGLDQAIEDIQNVLDHNTLQGNSRDALLSDVRNLRLARKAR